MRDRRTGSADNAALRRLTLRIALGVMRAMFRPLAAAVAAIERRGDQLRMRSAEPEQLERQAGAINAARAPIYFNFSSTSSHVASHPSFPARPRHPRNSRRRWRTHDTSIA